MDNSNKNKADDRHGENLLQKQRWRQSSNLKAPEERPYRRRIKPPATKVHHVHPARFRRFVQRRTCYLMLPAQPDIGDVTPSGPNSDDAAASTTSATTNLLQPPADAASGNGDPATDAGCLDVITRKSMQEAYMAWCSSNDIPLSPGTMAELSFTGQTSSDQGYLASTTPAGIIITRKGRES